MMFLLGGVEAGQCQAFKAPIDVTQPSCRNKWTNTGFHVAIVLEPLTQESIKLEDPKEISLFKLLVLLLRVKS